jgi:phage terminase large subunit
VQAVRAILPKSWFDAAGCAAGLKALRAYRRQWNERMGVWSNDAVHDSASHGADACGTGVQGARDPQAEKPKSDVTPVRLDTGSGASWMGA